MPGIRIADDSPFADDDPCYEPDANQIELSRMGQQALSYARRDVPVFPLRGKIPLLAKEDGGNGFYDATIDRATIVQWWALYLDANIGTPTGICPDAVTGQPNAHPFDVLDVDPRHGGPASLASLVAQHEPLPDTLRAQTGNDGSHLYFASDGSVPNGTSTLGPGLDVRGTGGYIVLPPSLHPDTNVRYRWANKLPRAAMPAWLHALIMRASHPRLDFHEHSGPIHDGDRNWTLFRLASRLRNAGCTVEEIADTLSAVNARRCRPPLDEPEIEKIAESSGRYDRPGPRIIVRRDGMEVEL